ncbi:3-hydroxyacyl-CoA dehydrogenase NAD-binding domain-containing protein [Advenella sp. RU8]|uniref:3-hydroxyacyl-CoA dehydrogenase NAD-binding domain-containing protein n=1 Tax=Advenella sp. RU8 TaxID=3399575 RepID=UPI003AAE4B1D
MSTELDLKNWSLHIDEKQIAWLSINCPERSMNALSVQVMEELKTAIDHLEKNTVQGLIFLSGKSNGFIVGADINEFTDISSPDSGRQLIERGWNLFNRIEKLRFPTLALIHGACLGGGMELALACKYRVLLDTPKPALGLPEVMLGIYPGWGGLKRLPLLIGPQAALDMILTGRTLDARKAKALGLVDIVVAPRIARQTATDRVLSGQPRRQAKGLAKWLNMQPLKGLVARQARKNVTRKDPDAHYPAPRAIIDIWARHNGNGLAAPDIVNKLLNSPVTTNLIRVFHLQERLKAFGKQTGTLPVNHVHVIGAGVMGGGIAAWCALQGIKTTLQDTDYSRISGAFKASAALFARKDRLTAQAARDRLIPDPEGHGIRNADLVIEAIYENAEAKQALYQKLEALMKPDAILASNTSSLSIQALRTGLKRPERFLGIHFFNPVAKMPLVEIVHAEGISQQTIDRACAFAGQIGKLPLPVQDTPGFLVNAVLAPYMLEAMHCIDEGIAPEIIDTAMLKFGMPMGPIELADTVGLDIALAAGTQLSGDKPVPKCIAALVGQKKLGIKTGEGFYNWKNRKHGIRSDKPVPDGLAQRLISPLIEQAKRQTQKGITEDADLTDAGIIFGTGFAPFRGGPLHYSNTKLE